MFGIMIGTTALIVVLSVFNGFEDLVKSLYSSFYTDLKITAASGKSIRLSQQQLDRLKGINGIRNFSLIVEEKAMVQNGDQSTIVYVKGVDENYRYVTGVANHIVKGDYELGTADDPRDRKSTRLNSSHSQISYAVFCLKKKINIIQAYN